MSNQRVLQGYKEQTRHYLEKIYHEDINVLIKKRNQLTNDEWDTFFKKYCYDFISYNQLLVECLLIYLNEKKMINKWAVKRVAEICCRFLLINILIELEKVI